MDYNVIDAFQYIVDMGGLQSININEAMSLMEELRCSISEANFAAAENFAQYLTEYGNSNQLKDDWWAANGTIDELFDEFVEFVGNIDVLDDIDPNELDTYEE